MFLQIHRILLNNRVNYLTLVGRYEEGLIRQRNPKFEALNTQIVASKKLAYNTWLSHEKVNAILVQMSLSGTTILLKPLVSDNEIIYTTH